MRVAQQKGTPTETIVDLPQLPQRHKCLLYGVAAIWDATQVHPDPLFGNLPLWKDIDLGPEFREQSIFNVFQMPLPPTQL